MRIIFTSVFFVLFLAGFSQNNYYINPVKIPILLSGSFAELRSNHFHSGIDIKTQGRIGVPIYAVADGYVSRIVVSPTGFGKALYINHSNGTTSVYAHLSSFSAPLNEYVKNKQYKFESFKIDVSVPKNLFIIKQGDVIAKGGNSGSSGGPHLHFEIRDQATQEPLNPLQYNFSVTDNIAPKIFSLLVVPLTRQSQVNYTQNPKIYPVVFYNGKYHLKGNPVIPAYGNIGIAICANDYLNGTYNKCGINLLRMALDEETQFTFQLNRFSFANSRYINSHIVYNRYKSTKQRFHKTWLDAGNKLPIYTHNGSEGIITPQLNKIHTVEIELQDTHGNSSSLKFKIKGAYKELPEKKPTYSAKFSYNSTNLFSEKDMQLTIPKGALYTNIDFIYSVKPSPSKFYSDYHVIHNKNTPLHKAAKIKIKARNLPEELQDKVVMANVNPENGSFYASGGKYKNGWVETSTRNFGVYALTVDTIPPKIIPLSIKNGKLSESKRIRFKISDDLSGIKRIEGLLNGKWALFEYNPKRKQIVHYFDKNRFKLGKQHNLKLTIVDYRDNQSVYKVRFWK